jgi:hypothetical protein
VWPPTYHLERILEKACPNHAYPIMHKVRECGMMNNFMVSRSLTRGMELDKVLNEDDVTPFPREDTIMMIYNGCPLPGIRRMSNLCLGTPTHCD